MKLLASAIAPPCEAVGPGRDPANIDSVRGLACLLLVAYHVVGATPDDGLQLARGSAWHYAMTSLEFIRMPVFTTLSAYLYARRPPSAADLPAFWRKKLRRLLVPLVFATLVIWAVRAAFYDAATTLPRALFFAYQHLWFLQALLLLFLGFSLWQAFGRVRWPGLVLVALGTALLAQRLHYLDFLSIGGALYLAPYFAFGVALRIEPRLLASRDVRFAAIGIALIVLAGQQLGLHGIGSAIPRTAIAAMLCGMASVLVLLHHLPRSRLLAAIGVYSYSIYLWHSTASAATRYALGALGLYDIPTLFLLCLIAGLAAPILLHHMTIRVPVVALLVTGNPHRKAATDETTADRKVPAKRGGRSRV